MDFGDGLVLNSPNPAGFLTKISGQHILWLDGYAYVDSEMSGANVVVAPDGTIAFAASTYGDWFSIPDNGTGQEVLLLRTLP